MKVDCNKLAVDFLKVYKMKYLLVIIKITLVSFPLFAQWNPSNKIGLSITAVSFLNEDTLILESQGRLLKSTNGGKTYDSLSLRLMICNSLFYKSTDTIFVGSMSVNGYMLSVDGGNSWQDEQLLLNNGDTAFTENSIVFIGFFNASKGIIIGDTAGGSYQVFLTSDGGLNWTQFSNSFLDTFTERIPSDLFSKNKFYIDNNGNLKVKYNYKSILTISDYGETWALDSFTFANDWDMYSVAFKDAQNGIATIVDTAYRLIKTHDGGKTWAFIGDSSIRTTQLFFVQGTISTPSFYAAPNFSGLFTSIDDGMTWQQFDSVRHGSISFFNSERGISVPIAQSLVPLHYYKFKSTALADDNSRSVVVRFSPNPASDVVYLNRLYNNILLTDIQGRIIARFNKTNTIEVSELSNGLYWVTVVNENGVTATQKLLVQH